VGRRARRNSRWPKSVRAALTLVARQEAVLGIVYSTDAKVEPASTIVGTFPADSHCPPIIYPVEAHDLQGGSQPVISPSCATSAAKAIFEKIRVLVLVSPKPKARVRTSRQRKWTAIQLSADGSLTCRDVVATPLGIAVAWLLARREFWGARRSLTPLSSADGPTAGRHRLSDVVAFGRRGLVGGNGSPKHLGSLFAFQLDRSVALGPAEFM